jgi:hypothetical protein
MIYYLKPRSKIIGKGSLDNGYVDNFDNGFLNKYEKKTYR